MRKKKTKGKKRTKGAKRKEQTRRKEQLPRQGKASDKKLDAPQLEVGELFDRVVAIRDGARDRLVRSVNHEMLIAYWHIGREIVEQVQEGEGRAAYGRQVLKALSKRLADRYGKGFSVTNLRSFRRVYEAYSTRRPEIEDIRRAQISGHMPDRIQHKPCAEFGTDSPEPIGQTVSDQLEASDPGVDQQAVGPEIGTEDARVSRRKHGVDKKIGCQRIQHLPSAEFKSRGPRPIGHETSDQLESSDAPSQILHESDGTVVDPDCAVGPGEPFTGFAPRLSWSHYRTLTKVANRAERQFYEIEANAQGWSVPQLERQIDSLLFARLLKSRDKAGVLELSTKGQVIESPVDALKDPYVLDFLDLPDSDALHESDLEAAILHKLRSFLLELGKGFAFVARQQRLAFEDEHFYVDLVFYNITLKCYLLIDLKVGKLTHQDIGQMDSYIRLFDDQCTSEDDNPTIGLILCARRNEAIARYSVLSESEQIFAARYVQILPSVEELQRELERERRRLDQRRGRVGQGSQGAISGRLATISSAMGDVRPLYSTPSPDCVWYLRGCRE